MTATTAVHGLVMYGTHGVLPEEECLGGKYEVDVECDYDCAPAVLADAIEHALDYGVLCRIAHRHVALTRYRLIETLASEIAREVMAECPQAVRTSVTVRKYAVPIPMPLAYTSTSVTLRRDSL
jgi:dihydroneopterin aldolase/2-amino-4-hydroxy-6-hydroxymethyldihydropteridine diphosphokinase